MTRYRHSISDALPARNTTDLLHESSGGGVGAADEVLVHVVARDRLEHLQVLLIQHVVLVARGGHVDLADGRDERDNLNPVGHLEVLFSDRASGNSTCRSKLAVTARGREAVPMVSRAELRPPPEEALMSYLSRYVQSAWDGRGYQSVSE